MEISLLCSSSFLYTKIKFELGIQLSNSAAQTDPETPIKFTEQRVDNWQANKVDNRVLAKCKVENGKVSLNGIVNKFVCSYKQRKCLTMLLSCDLYDRFLLGNTQKSNE